MTGSSDNEEYLQTQKARRIATLITGYIYDSLTPGEHDELDEWVTETDENMQLFEALTDNTRLQEASLWMEETATSKALNKIKAKLEFSYPAYAFHLFNKWWHYIAAAICLFIIIATGFYIYKNPGKPSPSISLAEKKDIEPGGEKAMLILGKGQAIQLEKIEDGIVAIQGNGQVTKKDGSLQYTIDNKISASEVIYNTISTPIGGRYSLVLSDGTRIWLNAASSIRFPSVFSGRERKVAITGEVYFEVIKNTGAPFTVQVNQLEIKVIGTHFNVNGYTEKNKTTITLLEGSLKLIKDGRTSLLAPGQSGNVYETGITEVQTINDTGQAIAWKNGMFQFENTGIQEVMKEISRWYGVSVSYEGRIPDILTTGKAPRNTSLANVLKILALSGVHYKIEEKNLIVLP